MDEDWDNWFQVQPTSDQHWPKCYKKVDLPRPVDGLSSDQHEHDQCYENFAYLPSPQNEQQLEELKTVFAKVGYDSDSGLDFDYKRQGSFFFEV